MTSFCTRGLRCLYLTLLFLCRPNAAGVMGKSLVFFNQHWPARRGRERGGGGGGGGGGWGLTSESEPGLYIYIQRQRERQRGLT